jgi:DNA repair protein RadA/Sms
MRLSSLAEAAIESERFILGTLIQEPERFTDVTLSPGDFGTDSHRRIFDAMLGLAVRGESWDIVLLTEALQKRGNLAHAGGVAYIASLFEGLPRRLPVDSHAQRIKAAAIRRRLATLAGQLSAACEDPNESPQSISCWVRDELAAISTAGISGAVDLFALSTIAPRRVDWLWDLYLPLGMLAMLSGDPGCGKTFLALAVAAALSVGSAPASNDSCEPTCTLYLSQENDPARVVRPRFDSLGGDPSRLHMLGQARPVKLSDIAQLDAALAATGAKLLVIDPVQSYLGADVDSHRANETRPILDGLARLAQDRQCCIWMLRHLAKANAGRAIHRGLGSVDFTGAVRTELLAGSSADDPESRALVMLKSNLGRFAPSLGYRIDSAGFTWLGDTHLRACDVLAAETPTGENATAEVDEWLRNCLADGSKSASTVFTEAKKSGWTEWQVRRAKDRMGVKAIQAIGRKSGGWTWYLPNMQSEQSDSKNAGQTSDCTQQPYNSLQSDAVSDCTSTEMRSDRSPSKDGQIASGCSDCTLDFEAIHGGVQ